jgi:hypothetical protein
MLPTGALGTACSGGAGSVCVGSESAGSESVSAVRERDDSVAFEVGPVGQEVSGGHRLLPVDDERLEWPEGRPHSRTRSPIISSATEPRTTVVRRATQSTRSSRMFYTNPSFPPGRRTRAASLDAASGSTQCQA